MKKFFNYKNMTLSLLILCVHLSNARPSVCNSYTETTNYVTASEEVSLEERKEFTTPPQPPAPIIVSQTCSSAELQKTGTIPSGVMWYWQTGKYGTDTNFPATSNYIANASGTYVIRPLDLASNTWGRGSNVIVTLDPNAGSNWYIDTDGDGLGDPNHFIFQCLQPFGYVSNSDDQCPNVSGGGSASGCPAQNPNNQNSIYTITAQIPTTDIDSLKLTNDAIESIAFFDGLGRPQQNVAIRQGSGQKDIVTHIEYDSYGRQVKEYLPYASTEANGLYKTSAQAHTNTFYNTAKYGNTINPYSQKVFENSALQRVFEQTAPGTDWNLGTTILTQGYSNGHTVKFEHETNSANEVRLYNVTLSFANNTYTPSLTGGTSFYPVGTLMKSVTKDENWTTGDGKNHTTEEFTDKSGKMLLKRTYADIDFNKNGIIESSDMQIPHDTYYVYDDHGNLSYVLPPKVNTTDGVSPTELSELSYQYVYDHRNRIVEKKIPGKGWEYIIYDKLDMPILTQDALQRAKTTKEWLYTKYDKLGRVILTGLYKDNGTRATVQTSADNSSAVSESYVSSGGSGLLFSYTNTAFPTNISYSDVYTINYYDQYVYWTGDTTNPATNTYGTTLTSNTKGLATTAKVKILGVTDNWVTTITGYDERARPVYVYSKNDYLQTTDIVESKLDFTGRVLETTSTHKKTGKDDIITVDVFTYDHAGRLLSQTQKVNDQFTERVVKNNYDNLGQLESKLVGNGAAKGYTDVTSGISITDDLITKTTANGWNEGLATSGSIQGDGYLEYTVTQTNKYAILGLSDTNSSSHFNSVDFGIYIWSSNRIKVYENGVDQNVVENYEHGDRLKVERIGNQIYYKKNDVTFFISSQTSSGSLIGDSSFYSNGLQIKNIHIVDNSKGLQNVDYTYNVRGWLTNINNDTNNDNDLFNFNLRYNISSGTPLYNGNISQIIWNTANADSGSKAYTFTYDALNRITYGQSNDVIGNTSKYSLHSVFYDKNGNIENLYRNGHLNANPDANNASHWGLMDNLIYTYDSGNKLLKVTDYANDNFGFVDGNKNGNDYSYDINGNMIADANKDISNISYNHLNLPTHVSFGSLLPTGSIEYIYDASGIKLQKKVMDIGGATTITQYAGAAVYEKVIPAIPPPIAPDFALQFMQQPEGYIKQSNSSFDHVYQYKDHLGNVRLTYSDSNDDGFISSTTEIIEESNYYPFGLKHKGYNTAISSNGNSTAQKFKYNGKELEEDLGLNFYDYGARRYSPALGRWSSIDPLADKYQSLSPYVYVANTPIMAIDPDGERIIFVPGLGYDPSKRGTGTQNYADNITDALVGYTAKYGTTSQTVDGSHGLAGDMMHVLFNSRRPVRSRRIKEGTRIYDVASGIAKNVIDNPLKDGEQMNVVAFSQGSVTTAQAVVDIFRDPSKYGLGDDFKIDNLVLGGSPVSKKSKLYKTLLKLHKDGKIGNIMYDEAQLEGDMVTGMGGKNIFQAIGKGFKFLFKMLSKKKRAKDPHAQAAQDKDGKTTKFVIKALEKNEIH